MKMNGEFSVPTDRETVWAALNDPEVLKECLPGCEEIEKVSDTEMTATITAKAPVSTVCPKSANLPSSARCSAGSLHTR